MLESEARYRALFEEAADAIVVFDPNTLAILDFNDEACRRLGYSRKAFAKLKVSDLDVIESESELKRHTRNVSTEGVEVFETKHRTKRGTVLDVEIRTKAICVGEKTLIQGIWRDITERKRAEDALRNAHDELDAKVKERTKQLRTLTATMIGVEEAERERIGHILHEDLQQMLAAARYDLQRLRKRTTPKAKDVDVTAVDEILGKAIALTQSLSGDLVAPILHEGDLGEALAWLAGDVREKHGVVVKVDADADAEPVSNALRLFVFRSVRELLFNVAKHAQTKSALVSMKGLDRDRVEIEVRDEGVGFDPSRKPANSIGLFRIRERAEYLGGELRIASSPRQGASVRLILPRG